jgi:hypothetical protein
VRSGMAPIIFILVRLILRVGTGTFRAAYDGAEQFDAYHA